jgi:nucleoid-associated protein YejK
MRNYTDVRVLRGALHVVSPKVGRLRLTATPLDLGNGVAAFLVGHVSSGLADDKAKAAGFIVIGDDRASGLCRRLLESGSHFVERSGQLAQLLYTASEGDERVSDGSFLVLRCQSAEEPFVAMLKLDPSNEYRTVEDLDDQGRLRNRLELEQGILPSVRERLLKAAFVRSVGAEDYDMLLVDRQRPGEVVSRFFIQDFLGAEPALDPKTRTTTLYRTLTTIKNEVAPQLEPVELERLEVYINGQVAGDHVNIPELIDGLPVDEQVRQRFNERITDALPDRDFEVDSETALNLLKNRRFAGDNGLRVSIPAQFFRDMVDAQPPGDDGHWTITIHTREWREI